MIAEMIPESSSRVVLVTGSRSWNDAKSMRETFSDAWRGWGPKNATRPVLLSGHCPKGADSMAELMWREAGSEITILPADWSATGEQPASSGTRRWSAPPRSSARPGLRCCARPSSTSAGSPDARSEARSSSCRMHRGTSRTAPSTAGLERELRGSRRPT
ncbi:MULTISPECIES: SLOG family protein [unclassified Streptomyces]|uniref:SLOG family protein n=1 Tax=unclassified Streptomyces TaxID=2593676 RepID=UPI003863D507